MILARLVLSLGIVYYLLSSSYMLVACGAMYYLSVFQRHQPSRELTRCLGFFVSNSHSLIRPVPYLSVSKLNRQNCLDLPTCQYGQVRLVCLNFVSFLTYGTFLLPRW